MKSDGAVVKTSISDESMLGKESETETNYDRQRADAEENVESREQGGERRLRVQIYITREKEKRNKQKCEPD